MSTHHRFRFGVIAERATTREDWLALASRAEALGYSTLLIRDHLVPEPFGEQLAPLVALSAAAMVTSTLRLGTLVIDNDFRHPALLAKEVATLDLLSQGRSELGIGAGWLATEYEASGIRFDRPGVRIARLAESLRILKLLLSGEAAVLDGDHYQLASLRNFPSSVQRPHPPLLIGGGRQKILTLAGREADIVGILTSSATTGTLEADRQERRSAEVAQKIGWVRDGAGDRFGQIELSIVPDVIVTDDRDSAIRDYLESQGWSDLEAGDVRDMPGVLIGSANQIAADLEFWRDTLGFSYIVVTDADMEAAAPIVRQLSGT